MTGKTHQAFNMAVIASLCATGVINVHNLTSNDVVAAAGVLLGGILPDIDSPNSIIRNQIRRFIVPKGYRRFASRAAVAHSSFHHRQNCTHWPLFWIVVCVVCYTCFIAVQPWPCFFAGLLIGTMAHLLCDMFNPYGIMLFAPFSRKKWNLAKIPTNSMREMLFLLASVLTALILTVYTLA